MKETKMTTDNTNHLLKGKSNMHTDIAKIANIYRKMVKTFLFWSFSTTSFLGIMILAEKPMREQMANDITAILISFIILMLISGVLLIMRNQMLDLMRKTIAKIKNTD